MTSDISTGKVLTTDINLENVSDTNALPTINLATTKPSAIKRKYSKQDDKGKEKLPLAQRARCDVCKKIFKNLQTCKAHVINIHLKEQTAHGNGRKRGRPRKQPNINIPIVDEALNENSHEVVTSAPEATDLNGVQKNFLNINTLVEVVANGTLDQVGQQIDLLSHNGDLTRAQEIVDELTQDQQKVDQLQQQLTGGSHQQQSAHQQTQLLIQDLNEQLKQQRQLTNAQQTEELMQEISDQLKQQQDQFQNILENQQRPQQIVLRAATGADVLLSNERISNQLTPDESIQPILMTTPQLESILMQGGAGSLRIVSDDDCTNSGQQFLVIQQPNGTNESINTSGLSISFSKVETGEMNDDEVTIISDQVIVPDAETPCTPVDPNSRVHMVATGGIGQKNI